MTTKKNNRCKSKRSKLKSYFLISFSAFLFLINNASSAASSFNEGVKLYGKKSYREAAQQFELAMQASPSNSDAYYYCALSHQMANNRGRAKQLFEYITTAFPSARVAPMARTALNQLNSLSSSVQSQSSTNSSSFSAQNNAGSSEFAHIPDEVRIPFEKKGNDVIVPVQVNGRSVNMILDTGAGSVVIGQNHLSDLGIARGEGKEKVRVEGVGDGAARGWVQAMDIKLGPISRRNFPVLVQDNMPTDPLLGQTFLKAFNVNIDDTNRIVTLAKKGGSAASRIAHKSYYAKEVPFEREASGHMFVKVEVNKKPYRMMFDTGASGTCFTTADWKRLGFTVPGDARVGISRGVLGECRSYNFPIESLKLGPLESRDMDITVIESPKSISLLGMDFYGKMKYTIDTNRNVIIFSEQ